MRRAVRNLIRFVAAGFVIFGAFPIGLELLRHRVQSAEVRASQFIIGGGTILAGILLFAFSSRLAAIFTDDDDEGDGRDIEIPPGEV